MSTIHELQWHAQIEKCRSVCQSSFLCWAHSQSAQCVIRSCSPSRPSAKQVCVMARSFACTHNKKWENWDREQWLRVVRGLRGIERRQGVCYQWEAKGQCSRGGKCSFWHDSGERAKPTPKTVPSTPRGWSASRKRNLRGRSQSGKSNRQTCRDFFKGTCTRSPCDYRHPPECQFYKSETGCKFGRRVLISALEGWGTTK